jgi:hypothetical protein
MDDNLTNKEKKKLSNLLSKVSNNENDYDTHINVSLNAIINKLKNKIDEKRLVAVDYLSNNQLDVFNWPPLFINQNNTSSYKSFRRLILFYAVPLCSTIVFSSIIYSKIIYLVKKLFKVKGFWNTNLLALPFLLFFNVRVYCLVQTYLGFKFIESNYRESCLLFDNKNNEARFGDSYIKYLKKNNLF